MREHPVFGSLASACVQAKPLRDVVLARSSSGFGFAREEAEALLGGMCYRFHLKAPDLKKVAARLGAKLATEFETRHNIAPRTRVPVVRQQDGHNEVVSMLWGLVPAWSAGRRETLPLLANARAETAAQKPAFRDAFATRHCLVAASGFFEWEQGLGEKIPWLIQDRQGEPLVFAGLWEPGAQTGQESGESCAILTTTPNAVLAPLHDRMPVILDEAGALAWLCGAPSEALLGPCPEERLERVRLDPWVNSVHHQGERCLQRWNGSPGVTPPGEQLGLGL